MAYVFEQSLLSLILRINPTGLSASYLMSVYPDTPLTVDEYVHLYDAGLLTVWETVTFMPGAQKLVAHFRAHGVPMALATGSRRINHINKDEA
jgi:pseudouridine-5'-monophosphatase